MAALFPKSRVIKVKRTNHTCHLLIYNKHIRCLPGYVLLLIRADVSGS